MAGILAIKLGAGATLEGDATTGDVLKGKKFYDDDPNEIRTGTLELTGDAIAGDVRSGKTFYSNDAKTQLTGTFAAQEKTITSSVANQTVVPDDGKFLSKVTVEKLVMSGTYTATERSSALNMGESNTYRYVDTTGVPNSNMDKYTYPSGSTGGDVDLGATNKYRTVNAYNVYAKGKTDGTTAAHSTIGTCKQQSHRSSYGGGGKSAIIDTGNTHRKAVFVGGAQSGSGDVGGGQRSSNGSTWTNCSTGIYTDRYYRAWSECNDDSSSISYGYIGVIDLGY